MLTLIAGTTYFGQNLVNAVNQGRVNSSRIDVRETIIEEVYVPGLTLLSSEGHSFANPRRLVPPEARLWLPCYQLQLLER